MYPPSISVCVYGRQHVHCHSFILFSCLCEDISLMFSYHAHLSHLFLSYSFQPLLRLLDFSFLVSKHSPFFAWLFVSSNCCPVFFSLCTRLLLLLYVSQSRIPGTVIPLCAAQCERIFSTTRTPGEETGKATRHVHTRRHRYDEAFHTVLIYIWYVMPVGFSQKPAPVLRSL